MNRFIYIFIIVFFVENIYSQQNNEGLTNSNLKTLDSTFIKIDSVYIKKAIQEILRNEANRSFTDPKAPRFVLIDQRGQFGFGVGGVIKIIGAYGFDDIIPDTKSYNFIPSSIPVINKGFSKGQYLFSPSTSAFFLKMAGKTKKLGNIVTYISIKFNGNGGGPKLDQAYVMLGGFTIGRTKNIFYDTKATVPSIDNQGPNGFGGFTNILIRYLYNFKKNWSIAISAEFPSINITTERYSGTNNNYEFAQQSINQSVPDLSAFLEFKWNENKSHIRLAGLTRFMSYRDNITSKNQNSIAWGAQLGGKISIINKLNIFYQFTAGKGIAAYIQDLADLNIDLVPNFNKTGLMEMPYMNGWFIGLQYYITNKIFLSATYSQANTYYINNVEMENFYKQGQYIVSNIFWDISNDCQLGIEYLYGCRINNNNFSGHANRINLMVRYDF